MTAALKLLNQAASNYRTIINDPAERNYFETHQAEVISRESRESGAMDYGREVRLLSSMAVYATWQGLVGTVKLCEGDAAGWGHLSLCFQFRAWKLRTEVASGDRVRKTKGRLLRDGYAEALGHAILWSDWAFADWCGGRVLRSFKTREGAFTNDPYGTPFEPYVFQLYSLWKGEAVDFTRFRGCGLGPYADVVKRWSSQGDDFASALRAACDYHCDPQGFGEYGNVPYIHLPVEILATLRIRNFLGFQTPLISHPILETPFAALPHKIFTPDDPLLTGAIKAIRRAHPEIGDPW